MDNKINTADRYAPADLFVGQLKYNEEAGT